ncbi:MAG: HDIG domain-containing protein [Oligoflexia bacterium]|nr:HDIG domain-containing protein [Oligoflexia bacterium]
MNLRQLRPDQQEKPNARWNYLQHTKNFVGWVNKFGIERTFIGRFAHALDARFKVKNLTLVFLFCLFISFFVYWDFDFSYSGYKEGDVATTSIKSPLSFEVIDEDQTNQKKKEAENIVARVFDFDVGLYEQRIQNFRRAMKAMRQAVIAQKSFEPKEFMSRQLDFENLMGGVRANRELFGWLVQNQFKTIIENAVVQNLERWSTRKIVEDITFINLKDREKILVSILERGNKGEEFLIESTSLIDVNEVKKRISQSGGNTNTIELTKSLIVPNLTLNKQETEVRKQKARDGVSPIVVSVKKGQAIVSEGATLQKLQVIMLDELKKLKTTRHKDFVALVTAVFLMILLLSYSSYLKRFTSKVEVSFKDVFAMATVLVLLLSMSKFTLFVANTAFLEKFNNIPATFYGYLVPLSSGAMIVSLLIPFGEVVWLFSVFTAVVTGLLLDKNFGFMIVTFTASIIAARGVRGCKKRDELYVAGFKTGLVNAALIFCITMIYKPSSELIRNELIWNVSAGFLSGILASFVTLTLIPFFENIFVYTTDVKLLELSNLNHPLLKELTVKAPGTYHHSLVVGSMCENAAEEIGANPLLARVCAYYHDIGKTHHAQYFIENQRPGENKHDQISPGMSKTVLVAHVKDGVEMGLKYKLGKPIIDVIEQHHGTTLISFFYHKAKEKEDAQMHEIKEDEYRYPGPKPQFREAALCMLADSIEAAARSLDEPTPARLQNIVRNIIQKKFLDGQLDECNLTLKDLSLIEEAFARTLLSIYHQRIDYPQAIK